MHARIIRGAMGTLVFAVAGATSVAGCLDRPVVAGEPSTKTNFTQNVQTEAVSKVDILFTIDNSASMGDKQAYLEKAIPDLVSRLITPNCVNAVTGAVDGVSSSPSGGPIDCSSWLPKDPNSQLEFPPVHDMHIGVLSTSLGNRLGDQIGGGECTDGPVRFFPNLDNHADDKAHLLTRTADPAAALTATPTEGALADGSTSPSGFLAWFPTAAANAGATAGADPAITDPAQLTADFTDLIAGVHEFGCGIESQLETWYRFLIQPDPYADMTRVTPPGGKYPQATWVGVDTTIIKERHDFLRPDSLVAIIVLTDENDSEVDVRSQSGQGYSFMSGAFHPPQGTAACSTNPADPSCATTGANGPTYTAADDWGFDPNLRHVHMKAKYGIDVQFPIGRYVTGLTSPVVPDRNGEYPIGANGFLPNAYVGTNDCTNPLFAATLPDGTGLSANIATEVASSDATALCNLPKSSRPASQIFYAIIGGVPWQLLHFDPTSATNSALSSEDWVRILGQDPDHYNYANIDPHMVESYQPRAGATAPTFATAATLPAQSGTGGTSAAETAPQAANSVTSANAGVPDPYNGREWTTNGLNSAGNPIHSDLAVDREYACIFQLVDPTTGAPAPRDCSNDGTATAVPQNWTVPANYDACDCSSHGLTADQLSPVCDPNNPNSQLYAKAYPTTRELNLANKLGAQGIVSSICPIHVTDEMQGSDPLYGYRPAVQSIINRLKTALGNQCVPQPLDPDDAGVVPCLVLATLPKASDSNNPEADCSQRGLTVPDPGILTQYLANPPQNAPANLASLPTCEVSQLTGSALAADGSCKASTEAGWCYVTGGAAGACQQALDFSPTATIPGAFFNLQCIETSKAIAGGTGSGE